MRVQTGSHEKGSTLVLVAAAITALLSIVALVVDLGMLFTARSEAQRAADSAALAGAGTLINRVPDAAADTDARQTAEQFGEMNDVQGAQIDIDPNDDVDVELAEGLVRVRVHRDDIRGGPVGTWFARVFGIDAVNVSAVAAADAAPAGSARCLKPFSIYDRFDDVNDNGVWDEGIDFYDAFETGYGTDFADGIPGADGVSYVEDLGRRIVLKGTEGSSGDPCCPGTGPSWYYPWVIPQPDGSSGTGANDYRENIKTCNPSIISVNDEYDVEPGNMQGPTRQGINYLVGEDPDAYWDTDLNQVAGSDWDPWNGSPRIAVVPMFDPSRSFQSGRTTITFTNFMAIFIESVEGNGNDQRVYGRILFATGVAGGEVVAPALKFIHLVE